MLRGGQRTGPGRYKRDADGRLVNTSSPGYPGAAYPYIAANTVDREGELGLPPYAVVERAGVRVGFIGVTTESTPTFLLRRHAERFRFTDISDAVNRWVPVLRRRGVQAIVVLAHAGGPVAGRVRRARLRRRDRRGGARDELRGGRGDRGTQPLAARHPRAERRTAPATS